MTKKINHAVRVKAEIDATSGYCDGMTFYDALIQQAAGYQEAESACELAAEQIVALGANPQTDDVFNIIVDVGDPFRANGFNAGFSAGFGAGALQATYGAGGDIQDRPAAKVN